MKVFETLNELENWIRTQEYQDLPLKLQVMGKTFEEYSHDMGGRRIYYKTENKFRVSSMEFDTLIIVTSNRYRSAGMFDAKIMLK